MTDLVTIVTPAPTKKVEITSPTSVVNVVFGDQGPKGDTGDQGLTGATGPTGPAGPTGPGVNWIGGWDSGVTYQIDDLVEYEGETWVAESVNTNIQPGTNAEVWHIFAAKGETGATGADGAAGPDEADLISVSPTVAGGSNVQDALEALETAVGAKLPSSSVSTFGGTLIDDANAAAARSTLELGTIATQAANSVAITGGTISGITDLAVADGGTGASNAANARTNLGAAASGANSDITSLSGLSTALSIAQGGTGATSDSAARTSLGLGNVDNTSDANKPVSTATQTALDLKVNTSAVDTDTTLAANSDARIASQKAVKAYIDGLIASADAMVFKGVIDASANPNYPAADRGWTYRISVAGKIGGGSGPNVEAGDILICSTDSTSSGTHASVGAQWNIIQTNIDGALTTASIGSTVQAYAANLAAIAALVTSADNIPYATGSGTWALTGFTAAGRALVDDANAAAQRTTLELGTIATQSAANVAITGGTVAGITDLSVADGGTGASNASGARTNLGLAIGTDVQAYAANLAALAALVSAANKLAYFTGSGTAALTDLSSFIRGLLDDADAETARNTLGAAPVASPTFTGAPAAPTATTGTNTTQVATTAFVQAQIASTVPTASDTAAGKVELATSAEALTGTDTGRAVTPAGLKAVADTLVAPLTADRTYYIRSDGNDSNTGLTNSSGGAFLTIQKAFDVVSKLNTGGFNVTISVVSAGNYNGGTFSKCPSGGGIVQLIGASLTRVITTPVVVKYDAVLSVSTLKFAASGANCLDARFGGTITIDGSVEFGAGGTHIFTAWGGRVEINADYTISGAATLHWYATNGNIVNSVARTITITGTPAITVFAASYRCGLIEVYSVTFSGSTTGTRYVAQANGVIASGSTTFPGSLAGSTSTGGQYS